MQLLLLLAAVAVASAFKPSFSRPCVVRKTNGARSMTAILDVFAGLALANALNSNSPSMSSLSSSFPVAVAETKQGMYKEYTVDVQDDSKVRCTILSRLPCITR